jgi:hypothetical protein
MLSKRAFLSGVAGGRPFVRGAGLCSNLSRPPDQPGTPAEFAKFIAEQSPIWAELVKLSGATIEN